MTEVRTRFAPSPTGRLHIGGIRTALFNKLFALKNSGAFLLRIDDTDAARSTTLFEQAILEDLATLGLSFDEGPYKQSERTNLYSSFAKKLFDDGRAYVCVCSRERLDTLKKEQTTKGVPPRYDSRCADKKVAWGTPVGALRFRVDPKTIVEFIDLVHGNIRTASSLLGDFVIMGSDSVASYNFATAIDDALLEITHVIRGDDHISNTPRQLLILDSLGLKRPEYAHVPLICAPDGGPLGKRIESASIKRLLDDGYLPLAIINACARLGWAPGEGLSSIEELSKTFSLERLSKSPSAFDESMLKRFNKEAISRTASLDLARLCDIGDDAVVIKAVDEAKKDASTLAELKGLVSPFTGEPEHSPEVAALLGDEKAKKVLLSFLEEFEKVSNGIIDKTTYDGISKRTSDNSGEKGKNLFLPLRLALTADYKGMSLDKTVELLGKDFAIRRIKKALKTPV